MARLLVVGIVVALSSAPVSAEPMARFGLTFGVDHNAPEAHEAGPMLGVGASTGPFTGEVNYTYLSWFGYGQTIHRLGVLLRSDLYRQGTRTRRLGSWALFGEVGAARKWGFWRIDDVIGDYTSRQNELHVGFGFELLDRANRAAWQVGLRFGVARRDPVLAMACRGSGTCSDSMMPDSSGLAETIMLEWTWLLNR